MMWRLNNNKTSVGPGPPARPHRETFECIHTVPWVTGPLHSSLPFTEEETYSEKMNTLFKMVCKQQREVCVEVVEDKILG